MAQETQTREKIVSEIKCDFELYKKWDYYMVDNINILKHKVDLLEEIIGKITKVL